MRLNPYCLIRLSPTSLQRFNIMRSVRKLSSNSDMDNPENSAKLSTLKPRTVEEARKLNIPVERYSLSRGLALNRFEKDFLIYPEYEETEAVSAINNFAAELKSDLQSTIAAGESNDGLSATAIAGLMNRHKIFSLFVPSTYGGIDMCNKDLLVINEVLGIEPNLYMMVSQLQSAINILLIYGKDDMKKALLPRLASGEFSPAICIFEEESGFNIDSMMNVAVEVMSEEKQKFCSRKVRVIGPSKANLFFLFVKTKTRAQDDSFLCYVIEKESQNENAIRIVERDKTIGLNAIDVCTVEFNDVSVSHHMLLGDLDEGRDIAVEVTAANKITYGAAVVGFMKDLIEKVAHICNSTVVHNNRLADKQAVQALVSNMSMNTYILESMVYYIGGLLDENLVLATDIERAVIHAFSNKVLREAIASTIQIVGVSACDCESAFEKMFRDAITVMALGNVETNLIDQISMATLTSWAHSNSSVLSYWRSGGANLLKRLFKNESGLASFTKPKLSHFIAEHAHPSLEPACRNLEISIARLNITLEKLIIEYGKSLESNFALLSLIATVIEKHLAMVSTISRASRSYSVGLRHCDIELKWSLILADRYVEECRRILADMLDFREYMRSNPSLTEAGNLILNMRAYCIESPITRNW